MYPSNKIKRISEFKITVVAMPALLMALLCSCDGNHRNDEENVESTVREQTVETVRSYDLSIMDTLMSGESIFVSEPIPVEIRERMKDVSMPQDARIDVADLRYLTLPYYDFNGCIRQGEMVCDKKIASDLLAIFRELFEQQYQFCSIRLIDDFDGSDKASMLANNTSCFNYRTKDGSRELSRHALGLAVDVNPMQNPFVKRGKVYPENAVEYADRNVDFAHKIDMQDACYKAFRKHGFSWGGLWRSAKDYQHFEKRY